MIEITCNDRTGKKVRVKCNPDDTIGVLKLLIAAQTGIAGSTKIGSNCLIGGQVGIAGHLTIGNNVRVQAQSGIGKNIADGEIIQGSPAFNYSDFSKSYVHFRNLPKIVSDLEELKSNNKNQI